MARDSPMEHRNTHTSWEGIWRRVRERRTKEKGQEVITDSVREAGQGQRESKISIDKSGTKAGGKQKVLRFRQQASGAVHLSSSVSLAS